jgi:16S rRNA (cytidine1402-2'-O)-methyltransferase
VGGTVIFVEAPHRIQATLADLRVAVGECEIAVGRELTKAHEQLVRGPISEVLAALVEIRGEFTVVVDIGLTANIERAEPLTEADIAREFGLLTINKGSTRRQAIAYLAKKHSLAANKVYETLEKAKKSVE